MAAEEFEYHPAPSCKTHDNEHVLEDAAPPHYARCLECGTRFFLIAEAIIKDAGIVVLERPRESN
jgi:hypothetical protein